MINIPTAPSPPPPGEHVVCVVVVVLCFFFLSFFLLLLNYFFNRYENEKPEKTYRESSLETRFVVFFSLLNATQLCSMVFKLGLAISIVLHEPDNERSI